MRKRNLTLPARGVRTALSWSGAALTLSLLALPVAPVAAQINLLTNGGFESSLTGWTVASQITGAKYDASDPQSAQGGFYSASYADSDSSMPGTQFTAPISGLYSTPNTAALTGQRTSFAVSDMNAPGSHVLYQVFVAPAATLRVSWSQFVYDWSGFSPSDAAANSQYGQVDLVSMSDIAVSPFSARSASLLYGPAVDTEASQGTDPVWRNYSFDATGLTVGQRYALRFGVTDQQFTLNMAIDNAGVFLLNPSVNSPEPGSAALLAAAVPALLAGFGGTGLLLRRRQRAA